jgi:hypothetical protein
MSSILTRLKGLLAMAHNQAGEPEGETAARLAEKLMREHAVSAADIPQEFDADPLVEEITQTGARVKWRRLLLNVIARYCQCRLVFYQNDATVVKLYGRKSDVEVSLYIFEIATRQITAALYARPDKSIPPSLWAENAVIGFNNKLKEMKDAATVSDTRGSALMIRRADEAAEFMRSMNGRLKESVTKPIPAVPSAQKAGYDVKIHAGVAGPASNTSTSIARISQRGV